MNGALQTARSGGLDTVDRLDLAGLTLDLGREELRDASGTRIELRNRSFGVLRHLATNAGRVVTKDELLDVNWPGVNVTETRSHNAFPRSAARSATSAAMLSVPCLAAAT